MDITITLNEIEAHEVFRLLESSIESRTNRKTLLLQQRASLIKKILNSNFGFKFSGLWGFRRSQPYRLDDPMLLKEHQEISSEINKINLGLKNLKQIYLMLQNKFNSLSNPFGEKKDDVDLQWDEIASYYNQLGIQEDKQQLQERYRRNIFILEQHQKDLERKYSNY